MKKLKDAQPKGFLKTKAMEVQLKNNTTHVLDYLERPDSVAVLLRAPDGKYVFVEQFRPGPASKVEADSYTIEPVAGLVDKGEDPFTAAHRECLEEIGVAPNWVKNVGYIWMCPGVSNEAMHLFIGECPEPNLRGGTDESEDIKVLKLSEKELDTLKDQNKLNTPHALILYNAWKLQLLNEPPVSITLY